MTEPDVMIDLSMAAENWDEDPEELFDIADSATDETAPMATPAEAKTKRSRRSSKARASENGQATGEASRNGVLADQHPGSTGTSEISGTAAGMSLPVAAVARRRIADAKSETGPARDDVKNHRGASTARQPGRSKKQTLKRIDDTRQRELDAPEVDDAIRPAVRKLSPDPTQRRAKAARKRNSPKHGSPVISPPRGRIAHRIRRNKVAPFVPPASRRTRRQRRRDRRRHGFVELTQDRVKKRHKILPRSVIGISFMLLSLGLGAAVSGAAFYAYYDDRLATSEEQVNAYVEGFDAQFGNAASQIEEVSTDAIATIEQNIKPFEQFTNDQAALSTLGSTVNPSVWLVDTLDETGQTSLGSAFVVSSNDAESLLLTSLDVVNASTVIPGPEISIVKDNQRVTAELFSFDEERDLALLRVARPDMPRLDWVSDARAAQATGTRIYAATGLGGQGASVSPGTLIDTSSSGYQHTALIGPQFRGGPLLSDQGQVYGVVSSEYSPLGIELGEVKFAVPIQDACVVVLTCTNISELFPDEEEDGALENDLTSLDGRTEGVTIEAEGEGTDLSGLEGLDIEDLEELVEADSAEADAGGDEADVADATEADAEG